MDLYELEGSDEECEEEEEVLAKKVKLGKKERERSNEVGKEDPSNDHVDEQEQSGSGDDRPIKVCRVFSLVLSFCSFLRFLSSIPVQILLEPSQALHFTRT